MARSITFCSSRILPRHSWSTSIFITPSLTPVQCLPIFRVVLLDEVPDQQRDVLPPLPQRGQVNADDVQTVEQVLAESPFLDLLRQVPIGRGNQPQIDINRCRRADGENLPSVPRRGAA